MLQTIFVKIQEKRLRIGLILLLGALFAARPVPVTAATADQVLEWNAIMNDTVLAGGTSPLVATRVVALVSASVFDAVNGINPQFKPLHVKPNAPGYASRRAAAIQASYAMLIKLYPTQLDSLTAKRDASIAALTQSAKSIQAGVTWGQSVADKIWAWRLTDGFAPAPPPFVGVLGIETLPAAVGVWRPTPTVNAYGAGPQFASMTPWVLRRPSQFRLPPPLALTSGEYATDYNEVKSMGAFAGSPRSADQSELGVPLSSGIGLPRRLPLAGPGRSWRTLTYSHCSTSQWPMLGSRAGTANTAMFSGVRSLRFGVVILMEMRAPIRTRPGHHGSTSSPPAPRHILSTHPAIRL
jgi:hypothetical protein